MKPFCNSLSHLLPKSLLFACVVVTGCSSTSVKPVDDVSKQFSLLGRAYGMYMSANRGKPPAGREQFVEFLSRKGSMLESAGFNDVEKVLVSPRDNNELVVLFGKEIIADGPGGLPWIAHEQEGASGKRYAIGARGTTRELDPQEFAEVFGSKE